MPLDDNIASLMMAATLGSTLDAPAAQSIVEAPDGTRIVFYERSNAMQENESASFARTVFTGCFSIDGAMVDAEDGRPLEAGFEADFEETGGPVAAGIWFARSVDSAVQRAFEAVFGTPFADDGRHMDIGADVFLTFADSSCWTAYRDDEDKDDLLFEF